VPNTHRCRLLDDLAHRVPLVQEVMTNSLQHAPGAPVRLSVRPDEERAAIRMTVQNLVRAAAPRRIARPPTRGRSRSRGDRRTS
jgi:hypothetical protein